MVSFLTYLQRLSLLVGGGTRLQHTYGGIASSAAIHSQSVLATLPPDHQGEPDNPYTVCIISELLHSLRVPSASYFRSAACAVP